MTIGAASGDHGAPGDLSDLAIERALLARYRDQRAAWEKRPQVHDGGAGGKAARSQISMAGVRRKNLEVRAVDRYFRRVLAWMERRGTPEEPAAFQLSQEAWRLLLRLWARPASTRQRPGKEQT